MPDRFDADRENRIVAVAGRLSAEARDELVASFAKILFAHAAGEDLVEYDPQMLAGIARSAFEFFRLRAEPIEVRIGDLPGPDLKGRFHTFIELLTGDRRFIFDSVLGELQASGHSVRLVVHPILDVQRDGAGAVKSFAAAKAGAADHRSPESFVHVHVPLIRDDSEKAALAGRLKLLLEEVRQVNEDWKPMRARLRSAVDDFRQDHPALGGDEVDETSALLTWLEDDNFVFLGMRAFSYRGLDDASLEGARGDGLGLLRDPDVKMLRRGSDLASVSPEIRTFLNSPEPLMVTKANVKSRVHRRDYMDYIALKRFEEGRVAGELRILGLFSSAALTRSVRSIPLIRRKVDSILARAGFGPLSHSGKALLNILEHYPRTELFQADEDALYQAAIAVLRLEERPRVRALARRDRFDRFVSVLVFVPRERYSSQLRERIGLSIADMYGGHVSAFFPDFSLTHLTRVQFIIGLDPGKRADPAQGDVEARIRAILRTFDEDLAEAVDATYPADTAAALLRAYRGAFGSDYRAAFSASDAVADIQIAERLGPDEVEATFRRGAGVEDDAVELRFHRLGKPIPLSRRVPLLENMGFSVVDERTYQIPRLGGPALFIHDMYLSLGDAYPLEPATAERWREAVLAVWRDNAVDDGFNALVVSAGLDWRSVALLRTVGRYLRQTSLPYSIDYLWAALSRNPSLAALLTAFFFARFNDGDGNDCAAAEGRAAAAVDEALGTVQSLDDDTILRAFRDVIAVTQRSDFFAADSAARDSGMVTLKLDPKALSFVPAPRPFREIFVHSPEVEGVHLRFGPVARGGLRWSDRPQDYRTEVLGLVKAQQVKNAVIVPVGAKGGFVPMRLPSGGSREEVFKAGRAAYIKFIERLLSVTDNINGETIVPPPGVIRHDSDDPYLVVAADKGTATFSDTANAIAVERGFWLGDAFASGGSAGYDHKAMGITARGAWEAVKRHYREMDVDIQTQPSTVVGVGDMSGDVFGNGMLLSPAIRLVAAFDHRDIFIDPDPDPAPSLAERRRLFERPRSSWQDYDRSLLSAGGGVYSRSEKAIPLSPEARKLLGLASENPRPTEVLSAILKARADLLWFGGIGTYVRGPDESNAEVGDKANDAIRISATEIGAKVVGEGANLAMTSKARIAFSLAGGRCNSDAIDNSAGVNTSDVEVNIKIALAPAVRSGRLGADERLAMLQSMTEEVAALVLRNNYGQTLAISLEERRGTDQLPNQLRLIADLEGRGLLDRAVESLPGDSELTERAAAGTGLTRPEIGTLLAFAKIALSEDLVASPVPDDPYLARELLRYFPVEMRERFAAEIGAHRLRRDIIATQLANSLVNRGGPTLPVAARDRTGASVADLTRAYATVRDSFRLQELHSDIDALDGGISGALQLELYSIVQDVHVDRIGWFVRNVELGSGLAEIVAHYRQGLDELAAGLPGFLQPEQTEASGATAERLRIGGVPAELAGRLAHLPHLARATDVVLIAAGTNQTISDAAKAFFEVARRFGFGRIDAMIGEIDTGDYYEGLALQKARDSLETTQRELARRLFAATGPAHPGSEGPDGRAAATLQQVEAILCDRRPSIAKVTVAASLLSELART
jgi:glutamate dehydrogenase